MQRDDLAGQPVILGSGIAGLVCALALAPRPVVLVTAAAPGQGSSSWLAQGGVAAAVGAHDSPALHAADTCAAGAGLSDPAAAAWLAQAAPQAVAGLVAAGVRFDRAGDGAPALGLEAAHSRRRILHAAGDGTGREIIRALVAAVARTPAITVLPQTEARRIVTCAGRVAGVQAVGPEGALTIPTGQVVVATGGVGGLFQDSTTPLENWGRGLLMAAEAGAVLADLEFVQFHPTALDSPLRPMPLVSEAVRGEGAVLIDAAGRRIAADLPGADLAPRDQLARRIAARIAAGQAVFLDATRRPGAGFAARFPGIDAICRAAGIDPARQPIPVRPAVHYHMGGIAVDLNGRSTVPGLWACGEAAATGLHGANRLASNSLIEAAALATRVAADIAASPTPGPGLPDAAPPPPEAADPGPVRAVMSAHLGLIRDADGLRAAIAALSALAAEDSPARDPARLALCLAVAAEARRESRGAHQRRDVPDTAPEACHSRLTLADVLDHAVRLTGGGPSASVAARMRAGGVLSSDQAPAPAPAGRFGADCDVPPGQAVRAPGPATAPAASRSVNAPAGASTENAVRPLLGRTAASATGGRKGIHTDAPPAQADRAAILVAGSAPARSVEAAAPTNDAALSLSNCTLASGCGADPDAAPRCVATADATAASAVSAVAARPFPVPRVGAGPSSSARPALPLPPLTESA